MDHSHRDRTYKKSRFQQELEQSVSRKLISSLLLGCLLFCIAIAAVNALNQNARREDHLESVASTFHEVYNNTSAFLLDAGHTELFLSELRKDQDNLRYLISHYNVSALVEIQLILTDSKGNVRFTTFSEGEMNLHRQEFNDIAVDNACHLMRAVYTTVYHFRANSSEYVMIHPLYRDGEYQGAAAVYLNENDWAKLFSQYQYDAILTKSNGDVITCSNSSFLSQKNANKYLPADAAQYVRVNGNRYLRSSRSLENGTVLAYSFIYSPTNYSYLLVGLLLIVLLGLSWAAMFARIMHAMTEQMVKSVDTLVRQIRIIRKEDPDHIIEIDTGDEIEEIARQVNKMVRSIQELSQRNIALAEVNNRMEMQNLQAQINPHFIYNTLDNIRYLIPTDPQRAQQLIGKGDMLYLQGNDPVRVQCAFVDTPEVEKIASYISKQQGYPTAFMLPEYVDENAEPSAAADVDMNRLDPLFEEAARLLIYHQQGSTSLIQRKFSIGYNRAGRIMDQLERAGIVGPTNGSKAREVLCMDENDLEMRMSSLKN